MSRMLFAVVFAMVCSVCSAQNVLKTMVVPANLEKGTTESYVYTDQHVIFTLQEKEGEMSLNTFLVLPKDKTFKNSKSHLVNVDLCSPDGVVVKSIKYYTWVQSKKDRVLFYQDAIFGYHSEHASRDSKCDCYSKDVFTNVDLWNFICNEDGYVRMNTKTKDGEFTNAFWTIAHKQ